MDKRAEATDRIIKNVDKTAKPTEEPPKRQKNRQTDGRTAKTTDRTIKMPDKTAKAAKIEIHIL